MRALALVAVFAGIAHAEPSPVREAEALLAQLPTQRDGAERFRIADEAQALCEKAIAASPKDPLPHLVLSRALTVTDPDHPEDCRPGACQRAVDELKKARALDTNGVEAQRIASDLGIVLSRMGAFAEALIEYDRALRLVEVERRPNSLDDTDKAVLYGNSAETLMALGRLDEAIDRYRLAEGVSGEGDVEWQLAEWGLGVALDRDEQMEKARGAIARVLARDPMMARLSEEGVFFEPDGDIRYYRALGHEVAGDRKLAMAAWREYLALPQTRWARRARAHLEALKKFPPEKPVAAPEIAIGEVAAMHSLRNPGLVAKVAADHLHELKVCQERALREGKRESTEGEIRISLELTPEGYPLPHSHFTDSTIGNAAMVRCVELAATNWRFPAVKTQELETVLLPIRFGAGP